MKNQPQPQSPAPGKRPWRRIASIMGILLVGLYLSLSLVLASFQKTMIYPSPTFLGPEPLPKEEIRWEVNDQHAGIRLNSGQSEAWVLFHGNGGTAGRLRYFFEDLPHRDQATRYIVEYPGFGANHSQPLGYDSLMEHCRQLMASIYAEHDEVVLVGQSLGSGPAATMFAEFSTHKPTQLVLLCPYTTMADAARSRVEDFIGPAAHLFPISLLLTEPFTTAGAALGTGPVAVVVGTTDEVIPPEQGRTVYQWVRQPRILVELDMGHFASASIPDALIPFLWPETMEGE